jgi:hypothetical protein
VIAAVEAAWLFVRGLESVRIVRTATRAGAVHLHVQGPGPHVESRTYADALECMEQQAELERRLVAQGYALERFTADRRITASRPSPTGRERRR